MQFCCLYNFLQSVETNYTATEAEQPVAGPASVSFMPSVAAGKFLKLCRQVVHNF